MTPLEAKMDIVLTSFKGTINDLAALSERVEVIEKDRNTNGRKTLFLGAAVAGILTLASFMCGALFALHILTE